MENDRLKTQFSLEGRRVWVAGHRGMVGAALCRRLESESCEPVIVSRRAVDLRDQFGVRRWMKVERPDVVIIAAATVGGILANSTRPAEFLYDNLMIASNIIHAAYEIGVERLLFLGSSCIYPRECIQPMQEDMLLSGLLEPTNAAYALAKLAGIQLTQTYRLQYGCDFISAIPCNLYGPGDRYDLQNSHVIPSLLMKIHAAKMKRQESVTIWGSGTPLREFMYVDDLADGLVFLLKNYDGKRPINIGSGSEISILELARKIADVIGFKGTVVCDQTMPDGMMRKIMNSSRIYETGWKPSTRLEDGLLIAYNDYLERINRVRAA